VYVPHYYNNNSWDPYYLTRDNLHQRVVNLDVQGAVTVVSVDDFTRGVDWRRARKADRNMLASVNPVLDPLLMSPLRNAVVHSAWGRGKIDIPPGIAKKLNDTTVVTSTTPVAPAFRPDLAKRMRVNNAPDHAKGQKFQVRDERQGRGGPPQQSAQAPQAPVQQQRPAQAEQRGRGHEQREARRVEQPQRPQQQQQPRGQQKQMERRASAPQAERPARPVRQEQPRGERVAAPARPAPRAERPAPAPRAQPQPQAKHERPPQAQQKQAQPDKPKGGPPASPGGGKGKGKKP
ncbi:MAG TPA: hypothetical protein VFX63_10200, partial [Pyrinomonadaceae bacterium]|nr:hypothetical protein [Pyrinomonadaceae bacterium]